MIDLGGVYQIAAQVRDASGTLTDPDTAVLTVTLPDGTTTTPEVPLPSSTAGQLLVDYVTVQAGRHMWRMVTSTPATAYSDVFDVAPAAPTGIVSLADAKAQLNIPAPSTSTDDELRGYITAASGAVEMQLGRTVARTPFTDRVSARPATRQVLLEHVPVLALTSVQSVGGAQTWSVGDLDADPDSGLVTVMSGPPLCGWLEFAYDGGLAVVPERYRLACLIIVQHLWELQRGAMGVQMGGDDEQWSPGKGFAIPRRAQELLDPPLPGVA